MLLEPMTSRSLLLLLVGVVGCSPAPSPAADAGADASTVDAPAHDSDASADVPAEATVVVDATAAIDAPADAPVVADAPVAVDVPADTPISPTGCRTDADCDASTQFCRADMRCVPRECVPASARCSATGARERCDARGTAYVATPCASSESCRDGACLPRVCAPGAVRCAPTSFTVVEACSADGLGYATTDCAPGQSCVGGVCIAQVCAPGALRCSGASAVRRCNGDGLEYADPVACPTMNGCDPATNLCASWVCAPGTRSCDGNRARLQRRRPRPHHHALRRAADLLGGRVPRLGLHPVDTLVRRRRRRHPAAVQRRRPRVHVGGLRRDELLRRRDRSVYSVGVRPGDGDVLSRHIALCLPCQRTGP